MTKHPNKKHNINIGLYAVELHQPEDTVEVPILYNPMNDHFSNAVSMLLLACKHMDCTKAKSIQWGRNLSLLSAESSFFAMEAALNLVIYSLVVKKDSPIYIKENKNNDDRKISNNIVRGQIKLIDRFQYVSSKHDCCELYYNLEKKIHAFETWRNGIVHGITLEHDLVLAKTGTDGTNHRYEVVERNPRDTKGIIVKNFIEALNVLDIAEPNNFCKHDAFDLFMLAGNVMQFLTNHFGINIQTRLNINNNLYSFSSNDQHPQKDNNAKPINRIELYQLIAYIFESEQKKREQNYLRKAVKGKGFRKKKKKKKSKR